MGPLSAGRLHWELLRIKPNETPNPAIFLPPLDYCSLCKRDGKLSIRVYGNGKGISLLCPQCGNWAGNESTASGGNLPGLTEP
jgi:hypothetical protein